MITEEYWEKPAAAIKSGKKIIYIIGETDTGKTTFAAFLIKTLIPDFSIGFLDCDPGQTTIGPPCTVSMGVYKKGKQDPDIKKPDGIYMRFTGSTTPAGYLLQTVTGIKRLAEKALELHVDKLIIDSSGFVRDSMARVFQYHCMDLIRPDYIIEIYKDYSLNSLLLNFAQSAEILRMKACSGVVQKSPDKRRVYRENQFKQYFQSACSSTLELRNLGFSGRIPNFNNKHAYTGLLISLCNRNHFVITLGIVQDIDMGMKNLTLLSPPFPEKKVALIHFGSIYCSINGIHD